VISRPGLLPFVMAFTFSASSKLTRRKDREKGYMLLHFFGLGIISLPSFHSHSLMRTSYMALLAKSKGVRKCSTCLGNYFPITALYHRSWNLLCYIYTPRNYFA
jgi:hypothetical protein